MVADLDRHARAFANAQRLLDGRQQASPFVAHVGGVERAVGHGRGQFDQLLGGGVFPRVVDQSGGQSQRAGIQPFAEYCLHLRHLIRRRFATVALHGGHSHRAVANQHADVHAGWLRLEGVEVAVVVTPVRQFPTGMECAGEHRRLPKRRGAHAAVADDARGNPAAHLECHVGVEDGGEVVVSVDVDEPGCQRKTGGVEFFSRRTGRPDLGDALTLDRDVGNHRRAAGPVVDRCVADD